MEHKFKNDNENELKEYALKICKSFLGGVWKDLSLEEFNFSTVSGGLSNSLYYCALPENAIDKGSQTPKEALLRIYGPLQEDVNIIVTEAATFVLLSERGLGPKLYGAFPKGRLEEYIPSRSLKSADLRLMSTTIAKEMAKIHALNVPVKKDPDLFQVYLTKWLNDVEKDSFLKYNKSFALSDMYREEAAWLTQEMEKTKSPVVYCHNDLQGGNILLREDSPNTENPKLMLIDFEFGSYNFRGFDIGNQFCEWCFNYNTEEYPYFEVNFDHYPSRNQQIEYISAYLDELVKQGVFKSSEKENETEKILQEVKVFSMAAHFLWSLWSVKMTFSSSMEFAHREHEKTRRKAYWMLKEEYLKSTVCNGLNGENDANSNKD